jgi:outer membrane protein, heavy metal efflux system
MPPAVHRSRHPWLLIPGVVLLALTVSRPVDAQTQTPAPAPLTYGAALQLAFTRNLDLQAARRQQAIREGAIRAARQFANPDLSFEAARDMPHQSLLLSLPVELFGQRGRRIDVAKEEMSLAGVDVQVAERLVRRELRHAFYLVMAADERLRLAEGALQLARRIRDTAQVQFEAGAVPRLDVLQADLVVTRVETELDAARSERAAARAGLNAVLDFPPRQPLVLAGGLEDHLDAPPYEHAAELAAVSNVELVSLDRQIAVEQRRLSLLRAERNPVPVFTVGGDFNSDVFTTGPRGGVALTIPIFSRNQGEIAGSLATGMQLRGQRDAIRRTVDNDVFAAVSRIEAARRQLDAFRARLVPTATDLESLAEDSYRLGRSSLLSLLDAQRSLHDVRLEALQAALDLQLALADLEEIIGTSLP